MTASAGRHIRLLLAGMQHMQERIERIDKENSALKQANTALRQVAVALLLVFTSHLLMSLVLVSVSRRWKQSVRRFGKRATASWR